MVDLEYDESKLWSPTKRQEYIDNLAEMSLFDDHVVEGDVMVDAIQALIEEGESAESLAMHWKAKGNEMFQTAKKHNSKYYRDALQYYSKAIAYGLEALKLTPEQRAPSYNITELMAQIYSNRSAVHLALKNYGSCRSDAAVAIGFDCKHIKSYFRGAKASQKLQKPHDTLRYCMEGLQIDPSSKQLQQLEKEARLLLQKIQSEMDQKDREHQQRRSQVARYRSWCVARRIRVGRSLFEDQRVRQYELAPHVENETNDMVWPVLFLYDEYQTSDLVEAFGEHDTFVEHLANMFPEGGPYCKWDIEESYQASNLLLYVRANESIPFHTEEDWYVALAEEPEPEQEERERIEREERHALQTEEWIQISLLNELVNLLQHKSYVVPGIPIIHVQARNSKANRAFIHHKTFISIKQNTKSI
ncbi:hypothetical protein ABG067_005602 [Albugo candida]